MSQAEKPPKPGPRIAANAQVSARKATDAIKTIARGSQLGLWFWDFAAGTIVSDARCNAILGFEGLSAKETGERWRRGILQEDRERVSQALQNHLLDAGNPYDIEYRYLRNDGTLVWHRSIGSAVHRDGGAPACMIGFLEDVTLRKTVEEVVTRQQELLQTIFDRMPVMIAYMEPDGKFGLINQEWERTLGWRFEDTTQFDLFTKLFPDPAVHDKVRLHMANPAHEWVEFPARAHDDRTVDISWMHIRLSDGSLIVIGQDITERKRRSEHLHALMREIDHRVKNNLMSMLAMCEQSIRVAESPEAFRTKFRNKIRAMARMHMALAKERWEGVRMEDLVKLTLDQYVNDAPDRLVVSGESVMLGSRIVTPLGLTLHELGTNAQKHGAWSVPGGRVHLSWSESSSGTLQIVWHEEGGPPIQTPIRPGQGTQLISGFVEYELSGRYKPDYRPQGLHAELSLIIR